MKLLSPLQINSLLIVLCWIVLLIHETSCADDGNGGTRLASMDEAVARKYGITVEQWNKLKKQFDEDKDNRLSKEEVEKVMNWLDEKTGKGDRNNEWDSNSYLLYCACALLGAYVVYTWYKSNQGRYGRGGRRLGTGQTLGSGPSHGRDKDLQSEADVDDVMKPPSSARKRRVGKGKSSLDALDDIGEVSAEFVPPSESNSSQTHAGQTLLDNKLFGLEGKSPEDSEFEPPSSAKVRASKASNKAPKDDDDSDSDSSQTESDQKNKSGVKRDEFEPPSTASVRIGKTGNGEGANRGGDGATPGRPILKAKASALNADGDSAKSKAAKSKPKPPTPVVKPESSDEKLCRIFSNILNIRVEISDEKGKRDSWAAATFKLKRSDVPTYKKDVPLKSRLLFERRMAREVYGSSKIKFAIYCYETTTETLRIESEKGCDEIPLEMLKLIKESCVHSVIENLISEQASLDDDDLFAGVEMNSQILIQSGLVNFLNRLSGWAEDGAFVSQDLLARILEEGSKTEKGVNAISNMIRVGGESLLQVINQEGAKPPIRGPKRKPKQRLEDMESDHGSTLRGLEILLSHPLVVDIIAKTFETELAQTKDSLGGYFEVDSALGSLLTISAIPTSSMEVRDTSHPSNISWTTLNNFPKVTRDDLTRLEGAIMNGIRRTQTVVFKLLKSMAKKHREEMMSWVSAVVSTNEMRTSANLSNPMQEDSVKTSCGDGYMINLCSVLLDLCLPFCQHENDDKLMKISPSYCTSKACRLNYHFETCLAGGQIVLEDEDSTRHGLLPVELRNEFNFMTEIFHITARGMHVGFFTALKRFTKQTSALMNTMSNMDESDPRKETFKAMHLVHSLRWDCCILDPELLRKGSQFYLAVAQWLNLQLKKPDGVDEKTLAKQQKYTMSQIPEYMVKDMARWFWFLSEHGLRIHRDAISGLDMVPFVECCVTLLQRPDLVPGPIPAYRTAQALNSFVRSARNDRSVRGAGWGGMISSPLASIVHTNPAVTTHLGPALLHTYVSVAVVEGLDVDKEDFDKYGARADIGDLIENMWERQDFRASILKLCGSNVIQQFLGAILDTLLYQLHDSWARLANVKKLQEAKEDEAAWSRLSYHEQAEKEKFLSNEEGVSKGFMKMARKTLGLLDCVTKSDKMACCLTQMPLAQRAASAFLGFLDKLCGSKAIELKVKDMDKYNFSPIKLLQQILDILLRIVKEETSKESGFVVSMSKDDDYNEVSMAKALSVVQTRGIGGAQTESQLADLIVTIESMRSERPEADQTENDPKTWLSEIENLECDEEKLTEEYTENMEDERFDSAELMEFHSFQSNADAQPVDPGSQKAKTLMKEMKQWNTNLPIHPHASIFLRQDEERMDVVRALVTGPVDTPYSRGCFAFDVYFPANYPNIPPLVKLITTGNGTVRFNPNLYADGKVCLSLLGTWHGGDASQKWQAGTSSLYQVLVSIQSMILISDPMYNEPGYDGMRGTEEGETRSRQYNSNIRLWTVRHAMLGHLQNPPVGFETAVQQHFKLERTAILKQCAQWLKECMDKDENKKLLRVVEELKDALNKLCDDES